MNSGIYKIENKNTGEVYIGQSDNCERRLSEHKQKRFVPIDMWINVLGVDNFTFEIIETCPKEELDQKEQKYIEFYNSKEAGYNQQSGGFNNSSGEGNGRAKVNVDDVIKIRTAYAERKSQKEVYE